MPYPRPLPAAVHAAISAHPGRLLLREDLLRVADSHQISDWVRDGRLDRLIRAVYTRPEERGTPWQTAYAALAYLHRLQPGAPVEVGGLTALGMAGVPAPLPPVPTLVAPNGRRLRVAGSPVRVIQRLPAGRGPWDPRRPRLRPAAAALADALDEVELDDDALRQLVWAVVNRLRVRPAELVAAWQRMPPRQVRRLLALAADGSLEVESPAELRLLRDILSAHPPAPDCQVVLAPGIRVDFAYIFAALVIEYFGVEHHRDLVDEDHRRIFELKDLGLDVLVVTKSMTRNRARLGRHIHQRRCEREALALAGQLRRPPLPVQPPRLVPLRTLGPSPWVLPAA